MKDAADVSTDHWLFCNVSDGCVPPVLSNKRAQ